MVEILSPTTKMGRNTNGGRRTGNSRTYSDREEQDAELSTPTSNSYYDTTTTNNNNSKGGGITIDDHGTNPIPIKQNYRRNFGKDGIYIPPETLWSNNNQGAMNTHSSSRQQNETASQDNTASDRISPPQHQYYENDSVVEQQQQEDRMVDNDVPFDQPFDQANADESNIIERTMSGGRTVGTRSDMALRDSNLSDVRCDDSAFTSVVSSKFENIWVSSPDDASSPLRRPIINERSNMDNNNDDYLEDEDNNMNGSGRFIVPPPKYSGPSTIDEEGIAYDDPNYYQSSALITNTSGDPMMDPMIPPSIPQLKHTSTNNKDNSSMMMNGEAGYAKKYDEVNSNQHSEGLTDERREATTKDDDSLFYFAAEKIQLKKARQQVKDSKDYLSSQKNNTATTTPKVVPHRVRRRNRQRREEKILSETTATTDDDDDDCDTSSTENYGMRAISPTSLQERAHQAWKSRQTKKNSTTKSSLRPPSPNQDISNISNVSTNVTSIRSSKGANIVSFGQTNTIHRFESEQQDDSAEVMSLDRSLNSEYTKTIESEVEDVIKDIFLIGTPDKNKPGRRKYRYKPEVKRKISKELKATANVESSSEEDNTVPSLNESDFVLKKKEKKHIISPTNDDSTKKLAEERTRSSAQSRKTQQSRTMNVVDDRSASIASIGGSSLDGTNTLGDTNTLESSELRENSLEDPFNAIIGLVEGGLSAMTSAIGYALGDPIPSPTDDHEMKKERKSKTKGSKKQGTFSTSEYSVLESCGLAIGSPAIMSEGNRQLTSDMTDMMTKDLWFGSDIAQSASSNIYEDRSEGTASFNNCKNQERFKAGIYQLAIHAAYSVHKLQGVEYDDSFAIDLHEEVKICPVSLKLPLGIIFLENDGTLRARCVLCCVIYISIYFSLTNVFFINHVRPINFRRLFCNKGWPGWKCSPKSWS
jgi:hypothetical protein